MAGGPMLLGSFSQVMDALSSGPSALIKAQSSNFSDKTSSGKSMHVMISVKGCLDQWLPGSAAPSLRSMPQSNLRLYLKIEDQNLKIKALIS